MAGHLTLLQTSRHWLCFSSCVCFSWYSWPLLPCKLTATTPHCQPTTLHEFLLSFLRFPKAVLSNLALFNSRTFSWKLVFRQMPIKSTQSQNYPNGAWVTSLNSSAGLPSRHQPSSAAMRPLSRFPRLRGEPFQNQWNNATFWQILPQFQRPIPYLL